ncbi:MAG: MFS transporter [Candidatus Melainabacteria bacterium HGW-Melainabacteria-1]|nr:MAG: MFS transporter [Candidatus Melainabacteria bacterium HGW-Melainabacteria-1]
MANDESDRARAIPSVRGALTSFSLATLLAALSTSIANVALPTLVEAFGASFQQVQWVVLAYLLVITTLIVSVGRLGDLFGRRRLLLAGLGVYTLASVLCGLAPALWMLIAARGLQGLGAAVMMALSMASVREIVPKEQTGRAMGLLGTMSAIGTALGPSLGGLLLAGPGWRALFLASLPLSLLALVLIYRSLPADPPMPLQRSTGFDTVGSLLLVLTLSAYALAMTLGRGAFGWFNLVLLLAAGLGGGLFVLAQRRAASPLIPLALFRQRALSAGLAMSVLVSTVLMATLVVGPFYLSQALGLNPALVGLVMSVGPLVVALTGVPAGRGIDKLGANVITLLGLGGIASGALMLSLLPLSLGVPGYLAAIVMTTLGYSLFQTANNTAVMLEIAPEQRGVISGLLNLSRNLGLITGASLMGAVFALAAGTSNLTQTAPAAIATGLHVSFALAVALIGLALVIALLTSQAEKRAASKAGPLVDSPAA